VADGELLPFLPQTVSRLGAPFGADWTDYPVSDKVLFFVYGNIARVMGVYPTSNLAVMMAFVTAALSFYGCARFLRVRTEWSFCGALLFAFTFHTLMRGLGHLWLSYTYTVPCALLTTWMVTSLRHLSWKSSALIFGLVTSAIIGVSNPYNLFFYAQLLTLAIAAEWLGERRSINLRFGVFCLVVAFGSWALFQSDGWFYAKGEGASSLISRNYSGTEVYALKPIELLVPATNHHLSWFASIGFRYLRWASVRGEFFFPYLGVIGAIGFIWIFVELIQHIVRRSRKRLPAHGLQISWILLFSAVGGINSLMSLWFSLHLFRATNRFSIFISAIIGFFLVTRLARLTTGWHRWGSTSLALLFAAIGLYDQIPKKADRSGMHETLKLDQQLGRVLETKLQPASLIFQLPVVDFPETRPPNQLSDYEHFRLYLATNTQRFSYGTLKERALAQWQRDYEELPADELAAALEKAGFSAIAIDRRGYSDRGEALLSALKAAGKPLLWENAESPFVIVSLQSAPHTEPPIAHKLTFGQGWHASWANENPRWSNGPAVLSFFNPLKRTVSASLRFGVKSVEPGDFSLVLNRTTITTKKIGAEITPLMVENIQLRPGLNRFDLASSTHGRRVSQERWGLKSFAVQDLELSLTISPPNSLGTGP